MATSKILEDLAHVPSIGSWADAVNRERKKENKMQTIQSAVPHEVSLPTVNNGNAIEDVETITEVVTDKDGNRSRVITTFKMVSKQVLRPIADRKKWTKFGASKEDGTGPNACTTYVTDEVRLQFVRERGADEPPQLFTEERKKTAMKGGGHCRICKADDHWSIHCPYKEIHKIDNADTADVAAPMAAVEASDVAPSMRDRPNGAPVRRPDDCTCRVTNLPEDSPTLEEDLRAMFGSVARFDGFYLGRDRNTGRLKGYAFINYVNSDDAQKAVNLLNGSHLNHMILKVALAMRGPKEQTES